MVSDDLPCITPPRPPLPPSLPPPLPPQLSTNTPKKHFCMSVVGSLIFCLECGDLLDGQESSQGKIRCNQCNASYNSSKFQNLKVVTSTNDKSFPSKIRSKKSLVKTSIAKNELKDGAIINEKCPKCANDKMHYHTLQLRSADEGATVFYACTACGYRFRTNN